MKIIITFLLSITFISLNACSSKVIPIQGSAKSIEVKIENADQDTQYQLFSTSYEGVVDKKKPKMDGSIYFDISKANSSGGIGTCFFVSDGEDIIPITSDTYKFANPIFNKYAIGSYYKEQIESSINNTQNQIKQNAWGFIKSQDALANSVAYKNNQCVLPETDEPPEMPSNACIPGDETIFVNKNCQTILSEKSMVGELIWGTLGTVIGGVACAIGGPILAGVCASALGTVGANLGGEDEEAAYKICSEKTLSLCKSLYDNWVFEVDNIKSRPEQLRQNCIRNSYEIQEHKDSIKQLKEEFLELNNQLKFATQNLNLIILLKVRLNQSHYCY